MSKRIAGMKGFSLVVVGQVISLLGSGMTMFAISIWAWQETGEATTLALVAFFGFGPSVLFSPIAGALVDRWNRKLVMILSDLAAGVVTIFLFVLLNTDGLQIWHLYLANFIAGTFKSFQFPASMAVVTMMLPKEQYARANGMLSMAGSSSGIFSPILAGALIGVIGLRGIMLIDIFTFTAAIGALLLVFIPEPQRKPKTEDSPKSSLWQETLSGFRFILERPSLFWIQSLFFYINITGSIAFTLMIPMILARTGNDEIILASVMSAGAIGGFVGGLVLSAWGGPKRRIYAVLAAMTIGSFFTQAFMGLGNSLLIWSLGMFIGNLAWPILNGSNSAIWQAKVPPEMQGRVMSVRLWLAQISAPAAMLAAGPLADKVMEPAMAPGGSLVPVFGGLVGSGPGAGMAVIFLVAGVLGSLSGIVGYFIPIIRNVEDLLPDHDLDVETLANERQEQAEDDDTLAAEAEAPA